MPPDAISLAGRLEAHREGVPMMRAMLLEFPEDPACETLDRQYLLGGSLLVAPIFSEDGIVDYYLPAGRWTNFLTGKAQEGPGWRREQHGFLSLPLMVRPIPSLLWGPSTIGRTTTTRRMLPFASMNSPMAARQPAMYPAPGGRMPSD